MLRTCIILFLFTTGCASSRVLVKECQKLDGVDLQNCELVKKL